MVHKRRAAYDASKSATLALMASIPMGSTSRTRKLASAASGATSSQYLQSAGLHSVSGGLHTVDEFIPSHSYRSATAMQLRTPDQGEDGTPISAVSSEQQLQQQARLLLAQQQAAAAQQQELLPQLQLQQQLTSKLSAVAALQRTSGTPATSEPASSRPPSQPQSRTLNSAHSAHSTIAVPATPSTAPMRTWGGSHDTSHTDSRLPSAQSPPWETPLNQPHPEVVRKDTASPTASLSPSMTHDSGFRYHMQGWGNEEAWQDAGCQISDEEAASASRDGEDSEMSQRRQSMPYSFFARTPSPGRL